MSNAYDAYQHCELCPRRCGTARNQGKAGLCGSAASPKVARAALHFWEEPPISGERGSGAIFFVGCPLRCVFCQNHQISQGSAGTEVDVRQIASMMLDLQDQGALNINLVTPLHHAPHVRESVFEARDRGLSIPIVCNTSGYELAATVRAMQDVVDVWLTAPATSRRASRTRGTIRLWQPRRSSPCSRVCVPAGDAASRPTGQCLGA